MFGPVMGLNGGLGAPPNPAAPTHPAQKVSRGHRATGDILCISISLVTLRKGHSLWSHLLDGIRVFGIFINPN